MPAQMSALAELLVAEGHLPCITTRCAKGVLGVASHRRVPGSVCLLCRSFDHDAHGGWLQVQRCAVITQARMTKENRSSAGRPQGLTTKQESEHVHLSVAAHLVYNAPPSIPHWDDHVLIARGMLCCRAHRR